jgi:hypothetical protein
MLEQELDLMKGRIPYEKFKESKVMVSFHVCFFPTLLLEDVLKKVDTDFIVFSLIFRPYFLYK